MGTHSGTQEKTRGRVVTMTDTWCRTVALPSPPVIDADGKVTFDGRVEWFDKKEAGLALRVSFTGRKSWVVYYRVRGQRRRRKKVLGNFPSLKLADAREQAKEISLDAGRGLDPAAKAQAAKGAPTVGELIEQYIERYAMPQKKSWKLDAYLLRNRVLKTWGNWRCTDVKRKDVIALLDRIYDEGAPSQALQTLAIVRKMYNWAISREIVEANPCQMVSAPSRPVARDRVLSEAELRALWAALDAEPSAVVAGAFVVRLLTAQRGGEVDTMRWQDVDLEGGWWTIPATVAKNKLSHRVPLSAPVLVILKALQKAYDSQWVFPSPFRGGKKPLIRIQSAVDRLRKASGVDFVPHDLRRTAASHMTSIGIPRLVVSKILNHVEGGVTRVYDRHSYDAEKKQALDAWAERLLKIVGG